MIINENINFLVKKYNENRLSHIFLVETDDKERALEDVVNFVKVINCPTKYTDNCSKCNLCHLISTNTLPSLSIIYPDGQAIKKVQMEELKLLFSHKPYIAKYNVYIINDAEKFNSSSANTMLKFIEEPEQNTIGFLITNNKENVISTIKSRCEYVKVFYKTNVDNKWNSGLVDIAVQYIYDTEINKTKSIVINNEIIHKKLDKSQLMEMFHIMLHFYLDLMNKKIKYEKLVRLENISMSTIIKRIQLINDIVDKLNYNVNINLLLDYYILSLED